ncbi:Alpha/Beta hydrolase protein [Pholiota molesta]|nr:Alpha/Beta hydrolase protein [Pholiota molesta]
MMYAYRKQPMKTFYWIFQLTFLVLVRFPLWFVFYIPRSWRPVKTWSLKRAFMVNTFRTILSMATQAGWPVAIPDHTAISTDARGVWVEPVNELVGGELKHWAEVADVSSIRIPGYWVHKTGSNIETAAPAQPGEKVILQCHGGAYVRLSAHPKDPTADITKGYLKEFDSIQRVFSIEYRLTSGPPFEPAHPFPTQLIDALAGYNYLVNVVGFAPENIIISGDSAGGNLAHALTRYLTDYQGSTEVKLPGPPGALILLSPWVDMGTTTQSLADGSAIKFVDIDYLGNLNEGDSRYAKEAISAPHGAGILETNPYISPASLDPNLVVDFKNFPPTFIVAGSVEVLYDSIITLKERMTKDLGDQVRFFEAPDGVHDYIAFAWHEPDRTNTLKEINIWLKSL